ncbi:MAG: hypothetical protein ACFFAS_20120 [Promethearchaeota archaeon]
MNDKLFEEILERTIFKEENLKKLMKTMDNLHEGSLELRTAKKRMLEVFSEMYRELCDLFPFYVNEVCNFKPTGNNEKNEREKQLEKELEENDNFLKQAAVRLKRIEEMIGVG